MDMSVDSLDEVIEEPSIDASCCSFVTDSSEQIKSYYKLKYPGIYSLSPITSVELLDNKQLYSELEASVESFINHNKLFNTEEDLYSPGGFFKFAKSIPIYQTFPRKMNRKNLKKSADISKISELPSNFSGYDSVHAIKVPLKSYCKKAKSHPYPRNKADSVGKTNATIAEVTQQMSGLGFGRRVKRRICASSQTAMLIKNKI